MSKRMFAAALCAAAIAIPTESVSGPPRCYGKEEARLAEAMLDVMPGLERALIRQEYVAKQVRQETCSLIARTGRVTRIEYATRFFGDSRNRPIWVAARERGMDPLRLQAALVDVIWPPVMI